MYEIIADLDFDWVYLLINEILGKKGVLQTYILKAKVPGVLTLPIFVIFHQILGSECETTPQMSHFSRKCIISSQTPLHFHDIHTFVIKFCNRNLHTF